jgi:L-aspartate oxidase
MDIQTEVLVIGAGIAGCAAALSAARAGAEVLLMTHSSDPLDSNTGHAQGGIVTYGPADSPELLAKDIMEAGGGLCHPEAVYHLAQNAPPLLDRLLIRELAVAFDRDNAGGFDVTEEAAHSVPRILHADGDQTGRAIILRLYEAVKAEPRITLHPNLVAIDLLSVCRHGADRLDIYRPETCAGVYALDRALDQVLTVTARQTILATGGLGQLYLHTTNPRMARGDGVAMAYRAGARLLNLEFIQFHPTTLFHRDADSFLISESLRGEGAVLVNHEGKEFVHRYHALGSLAPRDVVARAIQNEMLESGQPCVYLDVRRKDAEWLKGRFPGIWTTCLRFGIDITRHLIPVVPAAHYSCGGVAVDFLGNTTVPNLRAVGEVSCTGVHGANRLASTSLLEGLLWGWDAGADAARVAKEGHRAGEDASRIQPFVPESEPIDPALIAQDWLTIKYTMWNYVGLTRTPRRMSRAMSILRELQYEVLDFYRKAKPSDAIIGLRNGVTTALAVLFAAQRNHTSCGCHYVQED